ncbi:hypothetical protein CSQ85_08620 [Bifidobacterium rousetti]|uniref:hypothetical protein n=1 Tax=Bifidobacterium rousetti TaxID=2045439 RepID=UPI001238A9A7|nr:hypothetical protein [Bifidobacterium rousetti]KAA8818546.1 hypothetical protein CSQ85_08620 [Bifidobacterium rousetti]
MNGYGQCLRRLMLLMRYVVCRPAPLMAWAGLPVAFTAFAALTSVSVRLMFSSDSRLDGLATLTGLGPSIAGAVMPMSEPVAIIAALLSVRVLTDTATAMPLFLIEPKRMRLFLTLCADIVAAGFLASIVGGLAATGASRLILGSVVPARAWPAPLSASLLLCLPMALILTGRMLVAASLCVAFNSTGKGTIAYIALYYLLPIIAANLPNPQTLHEWLPSIAGTAILDQSPNMNPTLSGLIALAYVIIAITAACVAQTQRDV